MRFTVGKTLGKTLGRIPTACCRSRARDGRFFGTRTTGHNMLSTLARRYVRSKLPLGQMMHAYARWIHLLPPRFRKARHLSRRVVTPPQRRRQDCRLLGIAERRAGMKNTCSAVGCDECAVGTGDCFELNKDTNECECGLESQNLAHTLH